MIKLNTLYLENFMCVTQSQLDFTDQKVILLCGDNGNGKSAVLDAIALCLNEYCRSSSYSEYIKRKQKSARIILTADIKGSPAKFDVTITKNGLDRKVKYIRDKEYTGKEVTELIKTLEIDYYADIIMSMQDGDDNIVKMKPAKRANYLQKLLDYTYTEQVEFAKNMLLSLKKQIEHETDVISVTTNTMNVRKNQVVAIPEDTYTDQINTYTSAMAAVQEELKKYSGLNEKQKDLSNQLNILLQSKYQVSNAISNLEAAILNLPSLKDKLDNYNKNIEQLSNEAATDISDITLLNNSLMDKTKEISELENKKSVIITDLATARAELTSTQKHLSLIDAGKCPECGHEFTDTDKSAYEQQLSEFNAKVQALTNDQADLASKVEISRSDYNRISADVVNLTQKVNLINEKLNTIRLDKPKVEEQIAYLENTAQDELAKKQLELNDLTNKESLLALEQQNLADSIKQYETLNTDLQNAQRQLSNLNQLKLNRENIIKNNDLITSEVASLQNAIDQSTVAIEKLHRQEATYKEVVNAIDKELRDYAVIKTCARLEQEMNDFISMVFPNMYVKLFQNKTGIEFFYSPEPTDDKTKEGLSNVKMASGFEKATLSVAIKVALCKAYDLPFAFFDEADEKGSETNAANLFRSLLTNGLFDQVFIITQKPLVRDTIRTEVDGVRTYFVKHGNFSLEGDY